MTVIAYGSLASPGVVNRYALVRFLYISLMRMKVTNTLVPLIGGATILMTPVWAERQCEPNEWQYHETYELWICGNLFVNVLRIDYS